MLFTESRDVPETAFSAHFSSGKSFRDILSEVFQINVEIL